jgi:hypothetical protein
MPYIQKSVRVAIEAQQRTPLTDGELNYGITRLVDEWIEESGGVSYHTLNAAIGVLECAKLELYRRVAAPYEDHKRDQNGDVYICLEPK